MISYIQPPVYQHYISTELTISGDYKFGEYKIFASSKEGNLLNLFELLGGDIDNKTGIEFFLKNNPIISDNFNEITSRIKNSFIKTWISLHI